MSLISNQTYMERRHAERTALLARLRCDEARDQLDREIRRARAHVRRLEHIREALGR